MNEPEYKGQAWLIAEKTPEYLGHPTIPPIHWRVEGDQLVVLLADGRKARGPIQPVGAGFMPAQSVSVKKQPVTVTDLPVHKVPVPVRDKPSSRLGKKK